METSTPKTKTALYSSNPAGNIILGAVATIAVVKVASSLLMTLGSWIDSSLNPSDDGWTGFGGAILGYGAGAIVTAIAMVAFAASKGTKTDAWVAGIAALALVPISFLGYGFGLGF